MKIATAIFYRWKASLNEACAAFCSPYVFLPIIIGGMMYVLFRSKGIILNRLLCHTFLYRIVGIYQPGTEALPLWEQFTIYSAPNSLWVFSFSAFYGVLFAWKPTPTLIALACVVCLSVASEFMQLARWIPGTFDWLDIAGVIPPAVGILLIVQRHKKGEAQCPVNKTHP